VVSVVVSLLVSFFSPFGLFLTSFGSLSAPWGLRTSPAAGWSLVWARGSSLRRGYTGCLGSAGFDGFGSFGVVWVTFCSFGVSRHLQLRCGRWSHLWPWVSDGIIQDGSDLLVLTLFVSFGVRWLLWLWDRMAYTAPLVGIIQDGPGFTSFDVFGLRIMRCHPVRTGPPAWMRAAPRTCFHGLHVAKMVEAATPTSRVDACSSAYLSG